MEEMLRDNLQILQTMVRQREIDIFVKLLAESEMSTTFLHLIQCTCSCPNGVDATQRMVAFSLFGVSRLQLAHDARISHPKNPNDKSHSLSKNFEYENRTNSNVFTIHATQQVLTKVDWNLQQIVPLRNKSIANLSSCVLGYSLVEKVI